MELPRLQSQFSRYLQSLLALGYVDRDDFRPLYAAFVHTSGSPSQYFSLFHSCANTSLQIMEQALAVPKPDFPAVIAMTDNLLTAATIIGALRIRNVMGYIRVCATTAHEQGCLRYLKMLRFELKALVYSFNVITELESLILQLGGEIPLDW